MFRPVNPDVIARLRRLVLLKDMKLVLDRLEYLESQGRKAGSSEN